MFLIISSPLTLFIFFRLVFSSLSSSSYPWLVALWCLSVICSSFCPLTSDTSSLGLFSSLISFHWKSRAWSLFEWILFSSSSLLLLLTLDFLFIWGSLHPCCFHQNLPILLLTCPPSLLCCSMGNTGNHGEQVCDGNLAVVRYEPCPPNVHACMERC